jgi:hypothetical protein
MLAILVVHLALSPGLFWRAVPHENAGLRPITIRPLPIPKNAPLGPGLTVAGGWQLASRSETFGGYSALLVLPGHKLLAVSDRGHFLRIGMPTHTPAPAVSGPVGAADDSDKRLFDVEAATRDPVSGRIWLGYESSNSIRRYGPDLDRSQRVRPAEMHAWPAKRGPETMVRLSDGRFIVLSEALGEGPPLYSKSLLFPGDPIRGAVPEVFRFVPPTGFRPTDIAQLPDGRVVILLRRLKIGFSPWLSSRLVVADPATIVAGREWAWQPLTEIQSPLPHENYEGLAIEPREKGAVRLWLISDDNSAVFQRTLLLALDWTPGAKAARPNSATKRARGNPARPL